MQQRCAATPPECAPAPRPARRVSIALAIASLAACFSTGCFNAWLNGFLDPTELGYYGESKTQEIRRSLTPLDDPWESMDLSEPTPEDLIPPTEEYRIAAGDVLMINIYELLAPAQPAPMQVQVSEKGMVQVPFVGDIAVAGLTLDEIRDKVIATLRERQIIREPEVQVQLLLGRKKTYSIFGFVARPGTFPLPANDYRLMEALANAGGLLDQARMIYVIRPMGAEGGPAPTQPSPQSPILPPETSPVTLSALPDAGGPPTSGVPDNGAAPPEPPSDGVDDEVLAVLAAMKQDLLDPYVSSPDQEEPPPGATAEPAPEQEAAAQEPPATQPPTEEVFALPEQPATGPATAPSEEAARVRELAEAVAPVEEAGPPPTETQPEVPQPPRPTRWIWVNGRWVEVREEEQPPPPPPAREVATQPETVPAAPPTAPAPPEVEWVPVAGETPRNRVIGIPADALRNGEAQYNIVVHAGDTIRVATTPPGEVFVMGHVFRPGAYTVTGRQITLKQIIASAGGLDPLGWPDRVTVTRRVGDREVITTVNLDRIFAGEDPDIYLKPDDIVHVGSHPVAPFLAAIRRGFRVTYGFGFVYDRNFADIDSFFAQTNPRTLRQIRAQQRFPGLFP